MTRIAHITILAGLFLAMASSCVAQVATGTPPFSSFGGGPFDVVNIGNLNVHFTVPIINKKGRGSNFIYAVTYDNSIYYPVTSSGTTTWQPIANYGWNAISSVSGATLGFVGYLTGGQVATSGSAPCNPPQDYSPCPYYVYDAYQYVDSHRTPHWVDLTYISNSGHEGPQPPGWSGDGKTNDGSGYSYNPNTGIAYDKSGHALDLISSTAGSYTDANGNVISLNNGVFTDTLGKTALTVTGAGTPADPVLLQYTAPAGGAQYTVNYGNFNILTAFGCGSVHEYSASNVYLPISIKLQDGSSYQFQYEKTPGNPNYYTGRLVEVTLPTGGSITYSYTGANDGISCSDGSALGLTRTVAPNQGGSPSGTWAYSRAFGVDWQTTVTSPAGDDTVLDFMQYLDNGVSEFYETQRQVYQGSRVSGTVLQTTTTCYNGNTSNCTTTPVSGNISEKSVTIQYPNNLQGNTTTYYNGYGLPTQTTKTDFGNGAPGGILSNTQITYAPLGDILDHPSVVTVKDGSSDLIAETAYSYDEYSPQPTSGTPQHNAVSGSRGNVTTINTYSTQNAYLTRHFTYYDTGNVYKATDVNSAVTTYTYGYCGNSFVSQVSLPLGLSTSAIWDCNGGVVTSTTDENGKTATITYSDPDFWRPASATDQMGNARVYYYQPNPSYASPEVASFMTFNNGNSVSSDVQYFDGFGRTYVGQRSQYPNSSTLDSVSYTLDSNGRAYSSSMPCSISWAGTCSTPKTTQTYDALNRPLTTTDGGGGYISYTYNGNDVLQTIGPAPSGENTKRKQLEYDGLGRLTSVCEITTATGSGTCGQKNPQTGYWTRYTYDISGGLLRTTVTQNAQGSSQTRTYFYDLLGRLVTETNPESGTTTYFYDTNAPTPGYNCQSTSAGDMVKSIDANGNTICYAYDSLHRLAQQFAVGPNNPQNVSSYYVYDAATVNGTTMGNTKGKIAEAYTATCYNCSKITDEGFSYDADGNETDSYESTPSSAGYYHVNVTYWPNGAVDAISGLPGFGTITYGVDGEGRPSTVSATSGQNPVTATSYNTASEVTGVTFGSGDGDSYQFDPNTGRMTQYLLGMGSLTDTGNLTWNANGSLGNLTINDQINSADSQNCSYLYDDLERAASVNCGSVWNQSFGYDPFGNITKSGSSAWQPGYNSPTNRYTLSGTSYDADGNLLADTFHNYTWDAYGQLSSVDGTNETYDALGRMVMVGNTSLVMGPLGNKPYAFMAGQTMSDVFVPLPGGGMMRAAYGYRHGDWLGSVRLLTSFNRTLVSDLAYAPFGESYAHSGSATDLGFTQGSTESLGQISGQGLFDFVFRKYHSGQGRWISPDPAGMAAVDMTNPQSWNRYAYVMNNPLSMVDPFGSVCVWDDGSYDSWDDPVTGSPSGCAGAGGTWFGNINGNTTPDYNPNGNAFLAWEAGATGGFPFYANGTGYENSEIYIAIPSFNPLASSGIIPGGGGGGGGAANIASLTQGNPQFWKNYCSHQADLAAEEALLPGITRGDYVSTATKIAREAGSHEALDAASASTGLKYAIRTETGVPMSMTSEFLGYLTGALLLYSGYEAIKAAQEENQACKDYERVNSSGSAVIQAVTY